MVPDHWSNDAMVSMDRCGLATSHNSFPKMTISDSSSGAKALMAMMAVVVQVALMALAALVALLALVALVGLVFFQICSI